MDEEAPISFKDGDIVWVKLSPCWWPGEVKDINNVPSDITYRKPPMFFVQFFNEDSYMDVRNYSMVYTYNCEKKADLIRKGLALLKSNASRIDKFHSDIKIAEQRTDGNPNILDDPIFYPQKKINIAKEIFGTPQSANKKVGKNKTSPHKGKVSKPKESKVLITHRRFIGYNNDFEVRIRLQNPVEIVTYDSDFEDNQLELPSNRMTCPSCNFRTDRLEIMYLHIKNHPEKRDEPKLKKSPKKLKQLISKQTQYNDDELAMNTDSDEEYFEKQKQKRKRKKQESAKKPKEKKIPKKDETSKIRNDLFDDWRDDEDDEEFDDKNDSKVSDESLNRSKDDKSDSASENKSVNKSCFDFEEDEEEQVDLTQTTIGRKIPRVIPMSDKRKSIDPDNEDANLPVAEDDANRIEILKISEESKKDAEPESDKNEDEFKKIMESTSVPELSEIPTSTTVLKKNVEETVTTNKVEHTEVATKLTNPKKRFVKSFEDFEQHLNEQRRIAQEASESKTEEQTKTTTEPKVSGDETEKEVAEGATSLEISKLKCKIMSKLNEEESEIKVNKTPRHKTPRSKILESYRNDDSKKSDTNQDDQVADTPPPEPKYATRKSRYSKLSEKHSDETDSNTEDSKDYSERLQEKASDIHPRTKRKSRFREGLNLQKEKEQVDSTSDEEEKLKNRSDVNLDNVPMVLEVKSPPPSEDTTEKQSTDQEMALEESTPTDQETVQTTEKDSSIDEAMSDNDMTQLEDASEEEKKFESNNEIVFKCAPSGDDINESGLDIAIKTNLTNFPKDGELSALTTLATVSELKTNLEDSIAKEDNSNKENVKKIEEQISLMAPVPNLDESEMVPIDGNLTVVSEKDLADGQVEITTDFSETNKKPVTLTSFSMDFSDNDNKGNNVIEIGSKLNETVKVPDLDDGKNLNIKNKKISGEHHIKIKRPSGDGVCDVEEHIPSQIVCVHETMSELESAAKQETAPPKEVQSKLLGRLTEVKPQVPSKSNQLHSILTSSNSDTKTPIILNKTAESTKLIKPVRSTLGMKSRIIGTFSSGDKGIKLHKNQLLEKQQTKKGLEDLEESGIEAFIIPKPDCNEEEGSENKSNIENPATTHAGETFIIKKGTKKTIDGSKSNLTKLGKKPLTEVKKSGGKAKILQQTIITPAGEIIQPTLSQGDEFDINSMPIVLSDQILTPESIENMPILMGDCVQDQSSSHQTVTIRKNTPLIKKTYSQVRLIGKSVVSTSPSVGKSVTPKIVKTVSKIPQSTQRIIKQTTPFTPTSKYVIVTQSTATPTSKYTVGKKQQIIKRSAVPTKSPVEPTGNKIMIVTNHHGEQQRVLLTPAQQKLMGYPNQNAKIITKTAVKGNVQKTFKELPGTSGFISKGPSIVPAQKAIVTGQEQTILQSAITAGNKNVKLDKIGRKIQIQHPRTKEYINLKTPIQQKTVLIKNQAGQTLRKIQGTDDALLDQQVAEQLEAIKQSSLQQKSEMLGYKPIQKTPIRKSYTKKIIESPKQIIKDHPIVTTATKSDSSVPPLAPISPRKTEVSMESKIQASVADNSGQSERPLNQLIIQDAMGNQTTITEGQILALPSETVDGQTQSYMLVTLDESGNLTPLNNDALMSLDPSLGLGGDLGNTILQIDQGVLNDESAKTSDVTGEKIEAATKTKPQENEETKLETAEVDPNVQTVNYSLSGDPGGQQLIVTGDPIAAQKFLESFAEGNTDLTNILASAEGSSILIQPDGQIVINTDTENPMLLSVNTDNLAVSENSEGDGNPIFATQSAKNQDILAAALADTDVFQQDPNNTQSKVIQAQLSPNSALYPMNVGNVLETSLTLNSPIMTPLEVPSTNSKKISDENDILTQVPKNVDLPITITDPNITQTVSQQQVATLMANELQGSLELSLPISESGSTAASNDTDSPSSFTYPMDSSADESRKPFNSSMPLLTEDESEERKKMVQDSSESTSKSESNSAINDADLGKKEIITGSRSFLDDNAGLCSLEGEMCSSLSEPPPDMFDISEVFSTGIKSNETKKTDKSMDEVKNDETNCSSSESLNPDTTSVTTESSSSPTSMNEDSCEIPVQPEIITHLSETNNASTSGDESTKKRSNDDDEDEGENKKCKFD